MNTLGSWILVAVLTTADPVSLEKRFGKVVGNEVVGWADRHPFIDRSEEFRSGRDQCDFPLEVMVLQDLSAPTLPADKQQLADAFQHMAEHGTKSMFNTLGGFHSPFRMGVSTFSDKPLVPFGSFESGCYEQESALVSSVFNSQRAYRQMELVDGGDQRNDAFEAILSALGEARLGWTPEAQKLIVVVTGQSPHFEGDELQGRFIGRNFTAVKDYHNCLDEYYPSLEKVSNALNETEAYVGFVSTPGASLAAIEDMKYLTRLWDETEDFVVTNFTSIFTGVFKLAKAVRDLECTVAEPESSSDVSPTTGPFRVTNVTMYDLACGGVGLKVMKRPKRLALDYGYFD